MTNEAFVGKVYFERGDTGSPIAYTRVCQVFGISGLGKTNSLVDVTTFCSGGDREFISGLADGSEITLNLNLETDDPILLAMIQDVDNKAVRAFHVLADDGVHDPMHFYFDGVCLSWELGPSVDNKNTINFSVKVSGAIIVTVGD